MKILVDKIPAKSEDCLFARKEKGPTFYPLDNSKPFSIDMYYCNIDLKLCDLEVCENCSKLKEEKESQ